MNSRKPDILSLLAEFLGPFSLVEYDCWQSVKADALSSIRSIATSDDRANHHIHCT